MLQPHKLLIICVESFHNAVQEVNSRQYRCQHGVRSLEDASEQECSNGHSVQRAASPSDICQRQVNLPWKLRVGNWDGRSFSSNCEVACAPLLHVSGQDELEV